MVEDHPERCMLCGQEMSKYSRQAPYLCTTCILHMLDAERQQFNNIVASAKPAYVVRYVFLGSSFVFLAMAIIDYFNLLYKLIYVILLLVAIIINLTTNRAFRPKFKAFAMQQVSARPKPVDYVEAFEKDKHDKVEAVEKDKHDKKLEANIEIVTRVFRKISIARLCEKLQIPATMADEIETILERMIRGGKIQGMIEEDLFTRVIPPTEPSRSQ